MENIKYNTVMKPTGGLQNNVNFICTTEQNINPSANMKWLHITVRVKKSVHSQENLKYFIYLFNRPGVAGAVL